MEKISKEFYVSKTGKSFDAFVQLIFEHYRKTGFPYFPTNRGYRQNRFEDLMSADFSVMENNIINRTQHGINLAWSYFPHAFEVKCGKMLSPIEAFEDDETFLKVIRKSSKMADGVSDSTIRSMLRLFSGVQAVSNFRPTAAAAIYQHFAPRGNVWDMSGGWGGRLLGAIRCGVKSYTATEPSTLTVKGLRELAADFAGKVKVEIVQSGSEVYRPDRNSLDLCFTSPPYFDLEKYADEPTQSFKKFSTKGDWCEGFMYKTLLNCHHGLKKGSYCLVNIADPKKAKGISLEQETVRLAKESGFKFVNQLVLVLKSPLGSRQLLKYEPVFVFKKP